MANENKNVYQKLAAARVALQKSNLRKSGKNQYAGFSYFELSDFLPRINEIFAEIGLCSRFRIDRARQEFVEGIVLEVPETAVLTIINTDNTGEQIDFESVTADAQMKGASAIQQLGSVHTYMRRYLWLEAMEITECDSMDAINQAEKVDTSKPAKAPQKAPRKAAPITAPRKAAPITDDQIQEMLGLFAGQEARLKSMMSAYKINDLAELTAVQAQNIIARMGG